MDRSGLVAPKVVTSTPSRKWTVPPPCKAASKSRSARDKRGEGDLVPEKFTANLDESNDATGCKQRECAADGVAGWRDERKRPAISQRNEPSAINAVKKFESKKLPVTVDTIQKSTFQSVADLPDAGRLVLGLSSSQLYTGTHTGPSPDVSSIPIQNNHLAQSIRVSWFFISHN